MTRTRLLSVVLLALVTGLAAAPGESRAAACATVAGTETDSGLGGTGLDDPDSGVGGTGLDDPDSGIGGTGIAGTDSGIGGTGFDDPDGGIGGTGIFGTITGFASVCINGLEVHYDEDVPVTDNGEPASAADLAVGQVVWIVAADRGGNLVATSISMLSAVIGTVEQVDPEKGLFRVDGEDVEMPPSTLALGQKDGLIEPGVRVDVSGLRRPDGRVVASRIERARPETQRATMSSVGTLLGTAPGLRNLSIEGFAGARVGTNRFTLDGIEIEAARALPRSTGAGLRVTVDGPVQGKVLRAQGMTIERMVPERPERPAASDPRPAPQSMRIESRPKFERPTVDPRPEIIRRQTRPFKPDIIGPIGK